MEVAFTCEFCNAEFNSRHKLNVHTGRQHPALPERPPKKLTCNLCGYEGSQEHHLMDHMRTHPGEPRFKCKVAACGMVFKQESTLKTHIKDRHSKERPFKCNFPGCTYTCKRLTNLTYHKNVHSDDRPFACSECDYKTVWKNALKSHRLSLHSGRRDFKCSHPGCSKSFKSSVELKYHSGNRHGERNVPCDHPGCDKKYANASALNSHKRNVHSSKRLVCSNVNCSYRTTTSSHLARHMVVHHGEDEKISCSIEGCQYKGKHSVALADHMRLHNTLLRCPEPACGHFAPTREALEDHVRLHDPSDRPFQCPLCHKYYPTLFVLQTHCAAHTKEKPFACGHCDFAASFRPVVKRHISSAHANVEFPFIVHLLDDRECLECKVTLSTAEFLLHCEGHVDPVVMKAPLVT